MAHSRTVTHINMRAHTHTNTKEESEKDVRKKEGYELGL